MVDQVVTARGADVGVRFAGLSLTTVLLLASAALLVIVVLRAAAAYLTTLSFALAGNRLLSNVRSDLFAHLQSLPLQYYQHTRIGEIMSRAISICWI